MRTYGKINGKWVEVTLDDNGCADSIYLTTLIQCLKLSPNESPFYAKMGIPAQASVIQQVMPTYYVGLIQDYFSQYFASLIVTLVTADPPTYNINIMTNSGSQIIHEVAV